MRKNYNTIFYIFSVIFLLNIAQDSLQAEPTSTLLETKAKVAAYFESDCETAIITHINSSKKEIQLAIYTFTRPSIYKALANAQRRNVKVEIKYDDEVAEWKGMQVAIEYMEKAGITCTKITPKKGKTGKMHNKYLIIDKKTVITGSYNYTTAATKLNYENIIVVQSTKIATDFHKNFTSIK